MIRRWWRPTPAAPRRRAAVVVPWRSSLLHSQFPAAWRNHTGHAPEAQVSGDQIPKDHAEELGECFAAYAPGLFGYACALTQGDHALADDLVQAAFMAAARQWPTMRCLQDAQRLRWLHTTVGNLAISAFRRNDAFGDRLPRLEEVFRPRPGRHACRSGVGDRAAAMLARHPGPAAATACGGGDALAVRHDQPPDRGGAGHRRRNRRGPPVGRAGQAENSPGTL